MSQDSRIEGHRDFSYSKSVFWWRISIAVAMLAPVCSILIEFTHVKILTALATLFIVLSPAIITWTREIAYAYYEKGEKCRRIILYRDGLGVEPSTMTLCNIYNSERKTINIVDEVPYFATQQSSSPLKLVDMISESSFFTKSHANTFSKILLIILIIISAITILVAYFGFSGYIPNETLKTLTTAIFFFVSMFIVNDFILLRKKFCDLAKNAESIFTEAELLRKTHDVQQIDALRLAEDYNILLASTPPIPPLIHRMHRDRLNDAYHETHS